MVAADGTIVQLNGEIERTFGYQRAELIGHRVDLLVGEGWWARQDLPRLMGIADAGPGTTAARSRLSAERRDGSEIPIEITLSAFALASESYLIASVIDVADRNRGGSEPVPPPDAPIGRERLQDENAYLRNELRTLSGAPAIVGHSQAFRRVLDQVRHAAGSDAPVLLVGETGTGKSLLAARIHELSARAARAMVRVNCAHAGGRFDAGRLMVADGSTVLFDDLGSLPLEGQDALLHLLDDSLVRPPGGDAPVKLDLRIIAATRTQLMQRVAEGAFRADLYERLNVFDVHVSPLRERPEDIPPLIWRFVDEFSDVFGQPIDVIDKQTMTAMQRYEWPGNARELRNVVERGMMSARTRRLRLTLPGDAEGA